ncbi:c-type cytochrome biogenesis protein CcmI [Phaeobacter sp. B1627]|uniref:c-type cytochrome biogenesis protein CcmI n=1 Tax=Phaeobacter sp. B1627 TaxID=2583809 RepID=UPI0011198F7F|nr:c-type cytochrome biogenesis protein CcmI [Phaeobacter sp. B1627]TNJ40870.1 c-type cytochrome biogenesis protein CcmI [Phaeobacter sp. B1627]
MAFWILTGLVTLGMGGILALVLLRNHNGPGEPAAAYDLRVYRQQLTDLDRDIARGVVSAEDADRLRTEISRRVLAADAQVQAAEAGQRRPNGPGRIAAVLVVLVIALGTGGLYLRLGAPGYGDLSLDRRITLADERARSRPSQAEAEARLPAAANPQVDATYLKLVEDLRKVTAERPDDPRGQALLAQHEARIGNFKAAYDAKARFIALQNGDISLSDLVDQAELQVMAAGGYVSPEAEALLLRALTLSPDDGRARYYLGLLMGQIGRPDRGYQIWADTLRAGPDTAPWTRAIAAQIQDMAAMAGVEYREITPPPAAPESAPLPGPDAEDVATMQQMSPEDRQQMIEGMVSGLAERLATEGGSPAEWSRLITALGVLGRIGQAREIHAEALDEFAGDAAALDLLNTAFNRVENQQ